MRASDFARCHECRAALASAAYFCRDCRQVLCSRRCLDWHNGKHPELLQHGGAPAPSGDGAESATTRTR